MTRFRNVKLGIFKQYQFTKTIFKKKIWDRIVLRNVHFTLITKKRNFTLTWSDERKVNSVRLGMTYSKELQFRVSNFE